MFTRVRTSAAEGGKSEGYVFNGVGFCQSAFGEGIWDTGHCLADPRCPGASATERGQDLGTRFECCTSLVLVT